MLAEPGDAARAWCRLGVMADIAVQGRPGSLPLGSPAAGTRPSTSPAREPAAAGCSPELFPGPGHPFTDAGLPGEHDEQSASVVRELALASCRSPRG